MTNTEAFLSCTPHLWYMWTLGRVIISIHCSWISEYISNYIGHRTPDFLRDCLLPLNPLKEKNNIIEPSTHSSLQRLLQNDPANVIYRYLFGSFPDRRNFDGDSRSWKFWWGGLSLFLYRSKPHTYWMITTLLKQKKLSLTGRNARQKN